MDILHLAKLGILRPNTSFHIAEITSYPTQYTKEHSHDYYEIMINLSGTFKHKINGLESIFNENEIMLIEPTDSHCFASSEEKTFSFINIAFYPNELNKIINFLGCKNIKQIESLFRNEQAKKIQQKLKNISKLEIMNNLILFNNDPLAAQSSLRVMVTHILNSILIKSTLQINKSYLLDTTIPSTPSWLVSAIYIFEKEESFKKNGSKALQYFIDLCNHTREHISRQFKLIFNINITHYINTLRNQKIKNDLIYSEKSITEIFFCNGFSSIENGYRSFKKETNLSPTVFRKKKKRESIIPQ